MVDGEKKEDDKSKKEEEKESVKTKIDEPKKPDVPPVIAAGRRLERILTVSSPASATKSAAASPHSSDSATHNAAALTANVEAVLHSNPGKIVRRWLGTSSGTSARATLADLAKGAETLLDPDGPCATGRELVMQLAPTAESSGGDAMDVDNKAGDEEEKDDTPTKEEEEPKYLSTAAREYEAWLISLSVRLLWRDNKHAQAQALAGKGVSILSAHMDDAARVTARAGAAGSLGKAGGASGLYPLLARMHRYQSLAAEGMAGAEGDSARAAMRADAAAAHRMACLRRDVDTQATLLNLMLRDLLNANQVEQAQKLLSNSTFPDSASNNQLCRYLYNSGRIQALRLEYTSAFSNLSQCLRKAPTNTGLGFRTAVQRLLVVVQLLMGEIPERNVFFTEGMVTELNPYLKITQAVRRGDLAVFKTTVAQFAARLREDGTYTLISRLAHSVVKAGLRRLNISYSRISLDDVASRLGLPCATSAEFVVAKAVRDGVIDATIDHAGGYVRSHDLVDVYATTEPAEAFHRRIAYCLTTHNDAVRGMRYPPDAYKRQLEASRGLKGKKDDDKTDEEKAQELEDEMDEDY